MVVIASSSAAVACWSCSSLSATVEGEPTSWVSVRSLTSSRSSWLHRCAWDCSGLHAVITSTNAIRLYEKLGFEVRREATFTAHRSPTWVSR
jgi:hypothetical protein